MLHTGTNAALTVLFSSCIRNPQEERPACVDLWNGPLATAPSRQGNLAGWSEGKPVMTVPQGHVAANGSSLRLTQVEAADSGCYQCWRENGRWSSYALEVIASWASCDVLLHVFGAELRAPHVSFVRIRARGPEQFEEISTMGNLVVASPVVPPSTDTCRHREH
ncbi:hypothetical protein MRX96_036034 [Rhipicephalus microplus]